MKMQELNFCELYEWADRTAFENERKITSIIGVTVERLYEMFRHVPSPSTYEILEKLSNYLRMPSWDRLAIDDKEFKKLIKNFNQEQLIELFFDLGRLQGIRESWTVLENE